MADPEKKEEETGTGEPEKQLPKKSPLKLIIIVIVILVLLGGLGIGGYIIYSKVISKKTEEAKKTEQTQAVEEGELGPLYSMSTFIVNVAGPTGSKVLKVTMEFELDNGELIKELDRRKPQIRDNLIALLSSKTVSEISSLQGKRNLQREIIYKINSTVSSGKIKNVFFTEFVMQ